MTSSGLSDEVHEFIVRNLTSFEQLEVLMQLQADPSRRWTPDQLAAELRTSPISAVQSLEHLVRHRIISGDLQDPPAFGYAPATPELDRRVRALSAVYRERRVAVINLIFAKPDPLHDFAAAFRLGKDKKDG